MNKIKRVLILSVISLIVFSTMSVFAGGGKEVSEEGKVKVVLYVHGTLGDKSFMDSAARGIDMAIKDLGITGKIIEGGLDPARWEPDISQLTEGNWDIIIAGTWQMQEIIEKAASNHPEKKFFVFDTVIDKPNVYSILYSQNEASFLTGALAAMITTSDLPLANEEKVIGFLGGMDIPIINDFKIGFLEGVSYIDPEINVLVSYAGAFGDPAKGKELTLAMYDQGADITFNVAGETGLGGIDAAKDKDKYTLGVDSDQYLLFAETDPVKASNIVTSMMKNVDHSIYRGIKMHMEGTLNYGEVEVLNIEKGGVGLAENENYNKIVPAEMIVKIDEIAKKITSSEITVGTAF